MIGDVDPEDQYDASDPLHVRLAVLSTIVRAVEGDPDGDRRRRRRANVVRLLEAVIRDLE